MEFSRRFLEDDESAEEAAIRVLKGLTGLNGFIWSSWIVFWNPKEVVWSESFLLPSLL
jgi:ADP-ribose pyrophosphatase YjhB (NUDIX family)